MIIPTHIVLADAIFDQLQYNTPLPINKHFFRFGNIKPDLPWNFPGISHYRMNNFQEVLRMIQRTISFGLTGTTSSIHSFSVNAGIVCHFISDYFCTPHYNTCYYKDRIAEHLVYEKNLHRFSRSPQGQKALRPEFQWNFRDSSSVQSGIEDLCRLYSLEESSFENDLRFAVAASIAISQYMLQEASCVIPASPCFSAS